MGKVIVITGAGDGLGRALARRFARDGEIVILLGRTLSKIQTVVDEIGEPHFAVECDVSNPASVRAAFSAIASRHPKIDVLINNAAIFVPFTLAEATDDQISTHLNINVAGPIYCSRDALPLMQGSGHIINVSSESTHTKMPMLWLYSGTKTALEFMSDMWGSELAASGVRVTIVRAGQMMDETKTGISWSPDVYTRFVQEIAKVGMNLADRPSTHYNSATDVFRAVIDCPPDLHINLITLTADRR
jgi:meso-butanediol dehydrogenase / (S,S)-butanediol dehydrogenase / diacetyl reductase